MNTTKPIRDAALLYGATISGCSINFDSSAASFPKAASELGPMIITHFAKPWDRKITEAAGACPIFLDLGVPILWGFTAIEYVQSHIGLLWKDKTALQERKICPEKQNRYSVYWNEPP